MRELRAVGSTLSPDPLNPAPLHSSPPTPALSLVMSWLDGKTGVGGGWICEKERLNVVDKMGISTWSTYPFRSHSHNPHLT